jgi:hypothetical protein
MYATFSLISKNEQSGDRRGAFSERLIAHFRRIGLEIRPRTDSKGEVSPVVVISEGPYADKETQRGTEPYYRSLAYINLLDMKVGEDLRNESDQYCTFFGVTSRFQAYVLVTIVNEGEATVRVFKNAVDPLILATEEVFLATEEAAQANAWELQSRMGVGNELADVTVHDRSSGLKVLNGVRNHSPATQFLRKNWSAVATVAVVFAFSVAAVLLATTFDSDTNSAMERVVREAWPALLVGTVTLFFAQLAEYLTVRRSAFIWGGVRRLDV